MIALAMNPTSGCKITKKELYLSFLNKKSSRFSKIKSNFAAN